MYTLHDRSDFRLTETQLACLNESDGGFEGPHVHELDDLFDQTVFEKASIKLDDVFAILLSQVLPEIVEQLFPLIWLNCIDGLDCEDIFVSVDFADSSAYLSCASTSDDFKFLGRE